MRPANSTPRRSVALLLLALGAAACSERPQTPSAGAQALRTLRDERLKMGTRFEIQLVTDDADDGQAAIDAAYAEIDRVEALLSEWRDTSEISEVNRRAGRAPVVVGADLYTVVARSIRIAERTRGAFDISFAGCGRLWSFRDPRVPAADEIASCLEHVGYDLLVLDERTSTLFLPDAEMRIGIAGIGKGYGVDRAAAVLEASGCERYIVDGGGDIRIRGANVERPWRVGIADPRQPDRLWATLELDRGAIVTSGDYQRYFERGGKRYHHILDPATGRPADRSVAVTVIAPVAMDADALATGLFVMGPESGLELVETLPGVEALLFGPDLSPHRSANFPETER